MKTKKFDCVEMKHRGANRVQEQIAGMSREEEVRFWKERSQHLRKRQEDIKKEYGKSTAQQSGKADGGTM